MSLINFYPSILLSLAEILQKLKQKIRCSFSKESTRLHRKGAKIFIQKNPSLNYETSLACIYFSGRLKTREYCTHFQEGKRDFVENYSPISLLSVIYSKSSRALCSGGSTRSYIPPYQSRTAWLLAGRSCVTQLKLSRSFFPFPRKKSVIARSL